MFNLHIIPTTLNLFFWLSSYFILNGLERVVRLLILPKRNYVRDFAFCIHSVILKWINVFNLEIVA